MKYSDLMMYPYCEQLDDSSCSSYYVHFIISAGSVSNFTDLYCRDSSCVSVQFLFERFEGSVA